MKIVIEELVKAVNSEVHAIERFFDPEAADVLRIQLTDMIERFEGGVESSEDINTATELLNLHSYVRGNK